MTHAKSDSHSNRNYDQHLLLLKQATSCSEYAYGLQEDINAEGSLSQFISPIPIRNCNFPGYGGSSQASDLTSCFTQQRYRPGSDRIEMKEHTSTDEHGMERVRIPPISYLELIDASTKLDTGPRFTDFELFDPQFDTCESSHDKWLGPSISSGSWKLGLDDCKSFYTYDTPRSSEASLSQRSLCLPPPNSVTSSWRMSNEPTASPPTIYSGDYLEAPDSNGLFGVGQWMCETMIELDGLESEVQLHQNTGNNTAFEPSATICKALDSFECDFYGVQ